MAIKKPCQYEGCNGFTSPNGKYCKEHKWVNLQEHKERRKDENYIQKERTKGGGEFIDAICPKCNKRCKVSREYKYIGKLPARLFCDNCVANIEYMGVDMEDVNSL